SPQMMKVLGRDATNSLIHFPSYANPLLAWLSFFCGRSGPTMGVGLIKILQAASDSLKVRLNHSICSLPHIDFWGPSCIAFADLYSRTSINHICSALPHRNVR